MSIVNSPNPVVNSATQLLACAVLQLFPTVLLSGGGCNSLGFYYDFIFPQPFHPDMLSDIELRVRALIKENLPIKVLTMMRENAYDFLNHHRQPLLAEQAIDEASNIISLAEIGDYRGLAPDVQLPSTLEIGAIKLLSASPLGEGYRICGAVFPDNYGLKQFVKAYDKLDRFDHRLLGPQMNLFKWIETEGESQVVWYPKGEQLRRLLIAKWEEACKSHGIKPVLTPPVERKARIQCHRHLLFDMQQLGENPIRLAELVSVHEPQHEAQRWGLFCHDSFTSDLMTTLRSEKEVIDEVIYCLQFIVQMFRIFDFEAYWYLVESSANRESSQLAEALEKEGLSYIRESHPGLLPRIEGRFTDPLGRQWNGPSIELFPVTGSKGSGPMKCVAVSLFTSMERFLALLLERNKGEFPLWLAPEQIRILAVGEKTLEYAKAVQAKCQEAGFRAEIDLRNEKLALKVHEADKEKVPYLLIMGEKEKQQQKVTVRSSERRGEGFLQDLDGLLKQLGEELNSQLES